MFIDSGLLFVLCVLMAVLMAMCFIALAAACYYKDRVAVLEKRNLAVNTHWAELWGAERRRVNFLRNLKATEDKPSGGAEAKVTRFEPVTVSHAAF